MKTSTQIKFDALKMMQHKFIKTFTFNSVTSVLYDAFDDEVAVKKELIQMDIKHDKDINGVIVNDGYNGLSVKPVKDQSLVLTNQGLKDLKKLTKLDNQEIEKTSAQ